MRTLRYRLRIASALAMAAALVSGVVVARGDTPTGSPRRAVVTVKGLACPFCVYGLEKHLRKLPGATAVQVNLGKGETTIELAADSKVTEEDIRKAIRNAGFTADRIEWQVQRAQQDRTGREPEK